MTETAEPGVNTSVPRDNEQRDICKPTDIKVSNNLLQFDTFISHVSDAGITDLPLIQVKKGWKDPEATSNLKLADGSLNPVHRLSVSDARGIIERGGNVGCYGSPGGVEIHDIDLDGGEFKIPHDKIQELIKTFDTLTVMTRSGGIDFWFKNTGAPTNGEKGNPHIFYNGSVDVGERRRIWQYVLTPGSFVQKDKADPKSGRSKGFTKDATGYYTIIHDAPIREFNPDVCPAWYSFSRATNTTVPTPTTSKGVSDDTIVATAASAKNGQKFAKLFKGNTSGYNSRSEADMALAGLLAFYTQDALQIERIMRRSRLSSNEKWQRSDYLQSTIAKVLSSNRDTWEPATVAPVLFPATKDEDVVVIKPITDQEIEKFRDQHRKSFADLPELPDGFYKEYIQYGRRMSYAYPPYHLATALTITSLLFGRKVLMRSTSTTIYPNIFAMVIGATSVSGKSTACDEGINNFYDFVEYAPVIPEDPKTPVPQYLKMAATSIMTAKNSPQGFIENLEERSTRLWYYDECSEFFADTTNRWAEALVSNLCKAYDGRVLSYGLARAKGKKHEYTTPPVFVSCLWNTTCDEIENRVQADLASNGFLLRWMWFWCNENTEKPRAGRKATEDDLAARNHLLQQLSRIKKMMTDPRFLTLQDGRFVFNPSTVIEQWRLADVLAHATREHETHNKATSRLAPQAYKIAMLFTMMDPETLDNIEAKLEDTFSNPFPMEMDIPEKYAKAAVEICDGFLRSRLEYVLGLAEFNDNKNMQVQVIKVLKKYSGVTTRSVIQRETKMNQRNFDETILSMQESEQIEVYTQSPNGGIGRPVQYIRLIKT